MLQKNNIGIIGLGLIGGSIARALKKGDRTYYIYAYDNDEKSLKEALDLKVIDERVTSLKDGFSKCHIVFLCIPVSKMEDVLKELKSGLLPECILTDVGSTKADVIKLIKKINLEHRFIGGHPLTGSENTGFAASKANLFENAYYCITATEKTPEYSKEYLKALVNDMGAIPLEITPEAHDRVTAAISHLPHIVAAALVNLVGSLDDSKGTMKTIAAGGFKDITRIASSSPELWTGICLSNKYEILDVLLFLENIIKDFKKDLEDEEKEKILKFFNGARNLRNTFSEGQSLFQRTFDIFVDVDDRPGIIAVISSALANEEINIKNIGIVNNREYNEGALQIQFENKESRNLGIKTLNMLGYIVKKKD